MGVEGVAADLRVEDLPPVVAERVARRDGDGDLPQLLAEASVGNTVVNGWFEERFMTTRESSIAFVTRR